jgi:K+-transporting ATPase c subunit
MTWMTMVPSRSILLTALSYPLLVVGLLVLFLGSQAAGAVLTASGVFLIGINELCFAIARSASADNG